MRFTNLVAVAALFAATQASALVAIQYTVDDFDDNDPATSLVFDNLAGGGNPIVGNGPNWNKTSTFANSSGLFRNVQHVITVPDPTGAILNNTTGAASSVAIGSTAFPAGTMTIANQNSVNSRTFLSWTLPTGFLPSSASGPASLLFNLLFADSGINFRLFFDGVLIGADALPADPLGPGNVNVPLQARFDLAPGAQNNINSCVATNPPFCVLSLEITGATGFDLSLDSVGFVVPEPTSLALVGLGLVGAGLASRRRKA